MSDIKYPEHFLGRTMTTDERMAFNLGAEWQASEIESLRQQLAGYLEQHGRDSDELLRLCAARDEQRDGRLAQAERAAAAEARIADLERQLEAKDICLRSVAGALERAGLTECDDPGEAIDVLLAEARALIDGTTDDKFWPVDTTMSRKELVKQVGQMNYRLAALRQENSGLKRKAEARAWRVPEDVISALRTASVVMGCLPEQPGYNGSVLSVDDTERDRIVAAIDAAVSALAVQQQPPAGGVGLDGASLARAIFAVGDEPGDKAQRIAFRGGSYPDKETDLGGLNEKALAEVIDRALLAEQRRQEVGRG